MSPGKPADNRKAHVRAVLGPTNTGKTHFAVERMTAHASGMIGLPLRLLAREIYDRIVRTKGAAACALITGEEYIRPSTARYFACTVEAMPVSQPVACLAVDEIQLAADPERGHVFTDRILKARGLSETLLLGADTMRPVLRALDVDVDPEQRRRFSTLAYTGPVKVTKLPKRSAVVAFSAEDVYEIAELLRRQRGGCAVIMGALSPRTRNAQVDLYQSGEVDYIVATDAIGMGLNMDVGHVAFASRRKFDGRRRRLLRADEAAQIAGRAGRFTVDGTFGETADCPPFEPDDVARIEAHEFEAVEHMVWRSSDLDHSSIASLSATLRAPSPHAALRRAQDALDETVFAALIRDPEVERRCAGRGRVRRLWDLCSLPDFRKSGVDAHIRLVGQLHERLSDPADRLKDDWLYAQTHRLDRTEGDIDTLQQRLAEVRIWTYAANRSDWVENAGSWAGRTREIEDRLSDALHERLMQRFVDRRTSALLRSLASEEDAPASVDESGGVAIGGHPVGRLTGLRFVPETSAQTLEGRALRNAALKSLAPVIGRRLADIAAAGDEAFSWAEETRIAFAGHSVARLARGQDWLAPRVEIEGADDADAQRMSAAAERIRRWVIDQRSRLLAPLIALREALDEGRLTGLARGAAHQITESGAAIDRRSNAAAAELSHADREALRPFGLRVGRIAVWSPELLKPAPMRLILKLRAVFDDAPSPLVSAAASTAAPVSASGEGAGRSGIWLAAGYLRLGPRFVRVDLVDRLLRDLSRARDAAGQGAFALPPELAATIGCPGAEFPEVLRSLGLAPAERTPDGGVALWRFRNRPRKAAGRSPPPPDTPFAALSVLAEPSLAKPSERARKRKPRRIAAGRRGVQGDGP